MPEKFPHISKGRFGIDCVLLQNSPDQGFLRLLLLERFEQESADLIQADDPGEYLASITAGDCDHLIQDLSDMESIDQTHRLFLLRTQPTRVL